MAVVRNCVLSIALHVVVINIINAHLTVQSEKFPISQDYSSASNADPKIVGGSPISILQSPWQVSVRLIEREILSYGSGHICGGSVISQRAILSAAHCVANTGVSPMVYRSASEFTLVMGSVYLYEVTQYTLQYNVLQIVVNELFNITSMVDDISLFFINGYIPTGWPTVAPIPLNLYMTPNGTMCTVTGWGKTGNGYISSVLMGATVPIVSDDVCSTNYGAISPGMLCAGYMQTGGVDACQGDSGGPFVCNNYLTGIVSWGFECAEPGYPGIYTNVSYFYNWIAQENATLNYSYYQTGKATTLIRSRGVLLVFVISFIIFQFDYFVICNSKFMFEEVL